MITRLHKPIFASIIHKLNVILIVDDGQSELDKEIAVLPVKKKRKEKNYVNIINLIRSTHK